MDLMQMKELLDRYAGWLDPRLAGLLLRTAKKIPFVRKRLEKEFSQLLRELEQMLKPYRGRYETFSRLPAEGRSRQEILEQMEQLHSEEESTWREGFASGAVYHGDEEHIQFLNRVYAINSQANPLHSDIWPSINKYEAEIVAMTAHMLGADRTEDEVCGVVTSGGTESILLAMKAYRDQARDQRGIRHPELVIPVTAHAAFDKASQYFNIRVRRIPVDGTYKADVQAARHAICKNTIAVVGSAPSFPHGVIDPISELSEVARLRGVGFHTDACLGGFILPWAEKLGYPVPPFDFRLPGVTSMSADTHKYGYAAKGTSVVLYRDPELRRHQYYTTGQWPGGLYLSPTFAGSRPGALSAACWAAMISMGEGGYLEAARQILQTGERVKQGIARIPELVVLGDPLWDIAFAATSGVDIYQVLDLMTKRGWSLNGLHRPPCVHICLTLRHTRPGVADRFVADLQHAVEQVKRSVGVKGGMAPIYGMAATLPEPSLVEDVLRYYLDLIYKV